MHSQSSGTFACAKPLIMLPQMDTSGGRAAEQAFCAPLLSAFPPSTTWLTHFPRCSAAGAGWWVVGGWLSHGVFALVIYNHPWSHNASTSVRATTCNPPPLQFHLKTPAIWPSPYHDAALNASPRDGLREGRGGWGAKETGLSSPSCYCASVRGSGDVDSLETVTDAVDGEETGPEWWYWLIRRARQRNASVWTHTYACRRTHQIKFSTVGLEPLPQSLPIH